ncbi:CotH kinase family protein [Anatilimnocola floriformis]|uniref:CotH kinase family protein n=1 Tax=Anatilimnocola floriformis TaxID=2948575 RepID=UPI0020C40B12|nr:CotH kinase family protein [Anatilimnocola floriformis]
MNTGWALVAGLLSLSLVAGATAQAAPPRVSDASDTFFQQSEIPQLRITVEKKDLDKLQAEPRSYVKAALEENGQTKYQGVALKLKGAAGSYRDWDDRPALTLNMTKFNKQGKFHELVKFHLNNSVQDDSYLSELICSELFRQAGVPAARVTHARVWLNGRDVGLYVLKEGFDERFLKRHFADPTGNLYDGGFLQDLDADLEKDAGAGPVDHSDLRAITEALAVEDPAARWRKLATLVDIDAFLTFMALERMTCHWDGYANNMNNYRVYFDPTTSKACFFPHGMDQMFGDPGMGLFDHTKPMISAAVMQNNEWRQRYRERVAKLLPLFSPADGLIRRVDEIQKRLKPALEAIGKEAASEHVERVKEYKERLVARAENLRAQLAEPDPEVLAFANKKSEELLPDWYEQLETEDAKLERPKLERKETYSIACGKTVPCVASWRRDVLLGPGKYELRALVRTNRVISPDGNESGGAGAGISGVERTNHLRGTNAWKPLTEEFTIREDQRHVQLVLELRASGGRAWFDAASLRLVRIGNPPPPAQE